MKHTKHRCISETNFNNCFVCNGDLFWCTVCNGAEGSLPTDCPGKRMPADQEEAVQRGELDYVNGQWVAGKRAQSMPDGPDGTALFS